MSSVDIIVFYDDVNFITKGWIHRNRLLVNNDIHYFGLQLKKASQNKAVNQIEVIKDQKFISKSLKTIEMNYSKAKYFENVFLLIKEVLEGNGQTLADYSSSSVIAATNYLGLKKTLLGSSKLNLPKTFFGRSKRLIEITRSLGSHQYVNVISGKELYSKKEFEKRDVELQFLRSEETQYNQNIEDFISSLSMIDVLMNNEKDHVKSMLNKFSLI